jgi:predicted P-loop ATPase
MSGIDDFGEAMRHSSAPSGDWHDGLTKTEAGTARRNLFNACVALRDHPALAGKIAWDEFSGCTVVRGPLPWDQCANRPWSEVDDLKATEWLQSREVGIQVSSGIAREAVQAVSSENRFHPVLEYLERLEWDGKNRLSRWLTTYLGVAPSPLADAIGRKFLISAVARVMRPGCKVDHVLILEGHQGTWKSKFLRALVGAEWFTDQIADLGTKDSCQDLRGVWIVELSELSAIRPGEVERVKAYISRQVDHYRPSYGRRSIDVPRQCAFIGTTNDTEYLSDPTGGRRFWPVTCTTIDVDAIARDRGQLWAEAVAAYHAGEPWWLEDAELRRAAEVEQEARRIEDPWEAIIAPWLESPKTQPDRDGYRAPIDLEDGRVTVTQILEHAIGQPAARQSKSDQMRVGKVLRLLGWTKRQTRTSKIWLPPDGRDHLGGGEFTQETGEEGQKGGHTAKVVTQGDHAENGQEGGFSATVTTVTTSRAHVHDPCGSKLRNPLRGGQGSHGPNGSGGRERIGSCAYCFDAAYADDAMALESGGVLHCRCADLWTRS